MVYTTRIENYIRYYIVKANSPEEAASVTVKSHCNINYWLEHDLEIKVFVNDKPYNVLRTTFKVQECEVDEV